MGLTAIVPDTGEGDWLASFSATYESYAALQNLVVTLLENGLRGSRFPLYMRGRPGRERVTYASSESATLRSELLSIRQSLSGRRLPGVRLVMGEEEVVHPIRFGAAGEILPVYGDDEWELGAMTARMLFLRSPAAGTEVRARTFRRVSGQDFVTEDGRTVANSLLELGDFWEAFEAHALQNDGYILDEMIVLCDASRASGNPVLLS